MKNIGLLIDEIELEVKPRLPKVQVPYNGKLTTFEILGFLGSKGEPVTPYSLGEKLGAGHHLSFGQTMQFLSAYSSKLSNAILEPYQVTMKIAQDYPNIYEERKGIAMLTNTYAIRKDGKLTVGSEPVVMGMVSIDDEVKDKGIFFYGGEFEAEDIGDEVSFLDENLWPASKGNKVKRATISCRNDRASVSPVCVYFRDGKVQIHNDWMADTEGDGVHLPIVRKIE